MDIERCVNIDSHVVYSTRYAFESKEEAGFALGIVGSTLELGTQSGDFLMLSRTSNTRPVMIKMEEAEDLKKVVLARTRHITTYSASDHSEQRYLTPEQSLCLEFMVNWLTSPDISTKVLGGGISASYASSVAAARILRSEIILGEQETYQAAHNRFERTGIFKRTPKIPEGIYYGSVDNSPGSRVVTVTARTSQLARK